MLLLAGGRWGKTEAGCRRLLRCMSEEPGLYYWVGLSWRSASLKKAWRLMAAYARAVCQAAGVDVRLHINRSTHEIRLPNGAELWFRTAENPASVAGDGPRGVVGDEFTYWDEELWPRFLAPSLIDHDGWALLMGRPNGLNWAHRLYLRLLQDPGWLVRRYTSYDNPGIPASSIDAQVERMGGRGSLLVRQEILAEFLSGEGAVFRGVSEASVHQPRQAPYVRVAPGWGPSAWKRRDAPRPAARRSRVIPPAELAEAPAYVLGVDWGQMDDETAVAVIDATAQRQVYLDHFRRIPYQQQVERIAETYWAWGAEAAVVELNSIGRPAAEALVGCEVNVIGFTTTAASKDTAIRELARAIEVGELGLLDDETQVGQLTAYEARRLASGLLSYSAPGGSHDDLVIALMLAWYGSGGIEVDFGLDDRPGSTTDPTLDIDWD